jgi:hypothetical protein
MKLYRMPVSRLAVLAVVLLLANPLTLQALPPTDKDVRVINTPAEAVPVVAQGTTTIAGNVSVTNTPTVNLAPGTSVAVTTAAPEPYQKYVGATNTGTNVHSFNLGTVPAGKRLVIEFVSAHGQVPPGTHVELFHLTTLAGGNGATHDLLVHAQPDAVIGDAIFRASQQVKIYADPGTTVTALVRTNTNGQTTCAIAISGYFVDL